MRLEKEESEEDNGDNNDTSLRTPQPSYQVRLSAHLSSTHVMSPDLVPTPLFGRKRKIACIPFPNLVPTTNTNRDPDQEQIVDVCTETSPSNTLHSPHTPHSSASSTYSCADADLKVREDPAISK